MSNAILYGFVDSGSARAAQSSGMHAAQHSRARRVANTVSDPTEADHTDDTAGAFDMIAREAIREFGGEVHSRRSCSVVGAAREAMHKLEEKSVPRRSCSVVGAGCRGTSIRASVDSIDNLSTAVRRAHQPPGSSRHTWSQAVH